MEPAHTAYRIVPVTEATAEAFHFLDQVAFFYGEPEPTQDALASLDLARSYAATRTGEPPFAGIYSSYDMRLTIPAPGGGLRVVPMGGLTWVGVHPDERRRGVLTRMIRHHFEDLREQEVAVGGLHASETGIYGRFGYAVAGLDVQVELSRGATLSAPALEESAKEVHTTLVPFGSEGIAERVQRMHVAAAATQLGAAARTERMTVAMSHDYPPLRREWEPVQVLLATRAGEDVGYAVVRRSSKWEDGRPQGKVRCSELAATERGALIALARRVLDFDLTGAVTFEGRSLDDPLLWWAGGPRAATVKVYDAAWLRLVDVGAALAQRGYAAPVDLVLDVVDGVCEWNAGRWRLLCKGPAEPATCERTGDAADLTLPVQALGSAYVGLRSIAAQAEQDLVSEQADGAVAQLSAAMATQTAPVAQVGF